MHDSYFHAGWSRGAPSLSRPSQCQPLPSPKGAGGAQHVRDVACCCFVEHPPTLDPSHAAAAEVPPAVWPHAEDIPPDLRSTDPSLAQTSSSSSSPSSVYSIWPPPSPPLMLTCLEEIRIHDFALVAGQVVTFVRGLNVVTGESGSGKSVLVRLSAGRSGGGEGGGYGQRNEELRA